MIEDLITALARRAVAPAPDVLTARARADVRELGRGVGRERVELHDGIARRAAAGLARVARRLARIVATWNARALDAEPVGALDDRPARVEALALDADEADGADAVGARIARQRAGGDTGRRIDEAVLVGAAVAALATLGAAPPRGADERRTAVDGPRAAGPFRRSALTAEQEEHAPQ